MQSQGQGHVVELMWALTPTELLKYLKPLCLNRGMEERGREGWTQRQNKGGCPLPVCISPEGRRGLRLSVRQISLSPLKLMSGRGPAGNGS